MDSHPAHCPDCSCRPEQPRVEWKPIFTYQREVGAWIDAQFPGGQRELSALVVCEEAGELARAVVKGAQGIRGGLERWEPEIAKEAADVVITILSLCHKYDIDLEAALKERWAVVGARVVASPEEQAR
jgi:NTP pyrophosphatase (non-canonical NTP hydrolase)